MFINYTNHPSSEWSAEQLAAARKYGEIIDIPFPDVSPKATADEIAALAEAEAGRLMDRHPAAVLCQGEFTLCYHLIGELKKHGIPVLAACSERVATTETAPDGTTRRTSIFRFTQLREYE